MKQNKNYLMIVFLVFISLIFTVSCGQKKIWKPGMPLAKENIKIAVIHFNDIDQSSFYEYGHYLGIVEMQKRIGLDDTQIIRKVNVFDDLALVEGAMRDSIAEGANVIIATTFTFMDICEKLSVEFPSVVFLHNSGYKYNETNFTNYQARLYQVRYLSGIVAGLNTKSGKIGYVAAMGKDNSEVTGGINAFAIGVRQVNREAEVYVRVTHNWYDPMGETSAANALIALGCDVIAAHTDTSSPQMAAQKAGVFAIGSNTDMSSLAPDAVLTSMITNWGVFYTRFIESIINGTFTTKPFFFGLAEGAVDITPINTNLTVSETQSTVLAARQRIIHGRFNIFDGEITTNDGKIIGETGKTLSDSVVFGEIDWYYRNVIEK